MLNYIDLFSGIGGITLGLRGIANPVVYCDIDPACRDVLKARMEQGHIPNAQICPEVRILDKSWVRKKKVHLIAGGFPCVGFSALGQKEGFNDEQSGLFREVIRCVDVFEPPLVFMENVQLIVNMGLKEICEEFWKRDYELRWCTLSAASIGAPHERKRWFCLAVKKNFKITSVVTPEWSITDQLVSWDKQFEPVRMVKNDDIDTGLDKERCGMLGNAVVPDCVRAAFVHLVKMLPYGTKVKDNTKLPTNGFTRDGEVFQIEPFIRTRMIAKKLCFDPNAFQTDKPPSTQLKAERLTSPKMHRYWSTPRHGMIGSCNYLTERSVRDLPTQVRFERDTPDELRYGHINPEFVEWIMGYPPNWTKI